MLHHLADATIQDANDVNYNCHPLEDGNKYMPFYLGGCICRLETRYNTSKQNTYTHVHNEINNPYKIAFFIKQF